MSGPAPGAVDRVLKTLRRGHRQLAHPRGAIEAAVKQLLAVGREPAPLDADRRTYRIDDLARASGVTVRNIRSYTERGLLPAPQRAGRTALFDDQHLARLKIISSMLERGYTVANILEMLGSWEHGRDLGELLGLEEALVAPVHDEPITVSLAEARRRCGGPEAYAQLAAAGLVEPVGSRVRLLRPRLLESFAEMRENGMSTPALVEVYDKVQPAADQIAAILVDAGVAQLAPRFLATEGATATDVGELVEVLTRFRTLGLSSVTATLATSLEQAIETLLAEYLAAVVGTGTDADSA